MMSPAEAERLRTWLSDIVSELIPEVKWRTEGDELRAGASRLGLSINMKTGAWFAHALGRGGWYLSPLIVLIQNCSWAAAEEWVSCFAASHPGRGSLAALDATVPVEQADTAKQLLAQLQPPAGTLAEIYLRKRGIAGELPGLVNFLPDARCGESAMAALLTARGRTVGLQLTYLSPDGSKSLVEPVRRRFMLEAGIKEAVFEFPTRGVDVLVAEGLEDALSVRQLGRSVRIIGLPGIATLMHLPAASGQRITVIRDGDASGSPADQALQRGTDHLLLAGAHVLVTQTLEGTDANSLLQAQGVEALARLIAEAVPAALTIDGELTRLSRLERIEYDRQRKAAKDKLGLSRLETLDREVDKRRRPDKSAPADADPDVIELVDGPVVLAEVLDEILAELQRYIIAPATALVTVTLWTAHTHLVHHPRVKLPRSPRLAVQAIDYGAGKTTVLEAVATLVPRPRPASSVSVASIFRVTAALHPVWLLDEADNLFRDTKSELLSVMNSGDRRTNAWVERTVPNPDGSGGWVPERFFVFCAVCYACIGELPPTQQDRSVIIQMRKALTEEMKEHLEDGSSPELELLCRKLATWANDLDELPRPDMPDFLMRQAARQGDNWRWLIAIADLAGGRWPQLARQAAQAAVNAEARHTKLQRLLISIGKVFVRVASDEERKGDDRFRITAEQLIAELLGDSEEEWDRANKGRPITAYFLRDNLRHVLNPPGTIQWEGPRTADGQRGGRYRGYGRDQFVSAWQRYLPNFSFDPPLKVSGGSGVTGEPIDTARFHAGEITPDQSRSGVSREPMVPPDQGRSGGISPRSNLDKSITSPVTPDTPDGSRGDGKEKPLGRLAQAIVDYDRLFPGKSVATLAALFGQPETTIATWLGREK